MHYCTHHRALEKLQGGWYKCDSLRVENCRADDLHGLARTSRRNAHSVLAEVAAKCGLELVQSHSNVVRGCIVYFSVQFMGD